MPAARPVAHPDPATLTAFGLGRLPADRRAAVEAHVFECASCCEALEAIAPDSLAGLARQAMAGPGPADAPECDVPGALVDHPRYQVLGKIGAGGMGVVYKAEHRMMGRLVALKVVNRLLDSAPGAAERFRREVRLASRLNHPNIVTAFDADQAGPLHFLVMEYVDGVSLDKFVAKKGPLPVPMACQFAREAALGLQHAFEKGMVHRDIKPHNLMVTRAGQIKVLDFGLARVTDRGDASRTAAGVTAQDVVVGTPDFLAPEQARNVKDLDHRADIYSLGCTLYYLLTGRPPFAGGSSFEKLIAHVQSEAPAVSGSRADVPAGVIGIVTKMMAKRPEDRYQTPAEVAAALAPFAKAVSAPGKNGPPSTVAVAPPPPPAATLLAEPPTRPGGGSFAAETPTAGTLATPAGTRPTTVRPALVGETEDEIPVERPARRKKRRKKAGGLSPVAIVVGLSVAIVAVPVLAWAAIRLTSPAPKKAEPAAAATKPADPPAVVTAVPTNPADVPPGPNDPGPFPGPGGSLPGSGGPVPPRDVTAGKTALLVLPPLGVTADYDRIREEFDRAGVVVTLASDALVPVPRVGGEKLTPSVRLADADGCKFDAVVFVGGGRVFERGGTAAADAQRVIKCAVDNQRTTVAAHGTGMKVLMESGAMPDRSDRSDGGRSGPGGPRGPRPGGPIASGAGGFRPGLTIEPPFVTAGPAVDATDFARAVLRELGRPNRP